MIHQKNPLRTGFEPAREYPIGFQVQRLNHSAIAALVLGIAHLPYNFMKMYMTPFLLGGALILVYWSMWDILPHWKIETDVDFAKLFPK